MAEIIINDQNYQQHVLAPNGQAMGCVPRNLMMAPKGSIPCAKPFNIPLIPESEWQSRLDAQIAARAQLSNLRNTMGPNGGPIPSRDQNGRGYCWAHSSTSAALICRAVEGLPYADLSAYAVACIIKNYRDEGGWGAESLQFIADRGIPTAQFWPQQSVQRSNDNPTTWQNAAQHKFTDWVELDHGSMKQQLVTCLLLGIPVVTDLNWWGHSVCTVDLVSLTPFRTRIWNSWGDGWSDNGMGILEGSKAIPDDAVAPMVAMASEV